MLTQLPKGMRDDMGISDAVTCASWDAERPDRRRFSQPNPPSAPKSGLAAPQTTAARRVCKIAPAHIAHGSSVTYRVALS